MRKLVSSSFVSAVLGGGVTAAVLLLTGVVATDDGRTIIEQPSLSAASTVRLKSRRDVVVALAEVTGLGWP